jgi:hypothetical protein
MFTLMLAVIEDPVREAVVKALASYTGLAGLVVALVAGIKHLWPTWVDKKEPVIALFLTYLLGIVAKLSLPSVYGGNDFGSWALHLVVLLVVAVGAKQLHDSVINAFRKDKQ